MTTETEKLVYTVDEVSKMLSISRNLTYKLCREKRIPCIHLGNKRMLCPARAIDALLSGNSKPEN